MSTSLEDVLSPLDEDLRRCIEHIARACTQIADAVRSGRTEKIATSNTFGDEQLEIDVFADKILFDELRASGVVATASSEEVPTEIRLGDGSYSVAFDPLDGSSVIGTNFSVGTIFGVWPGTSLLNRTGRELIVGGCAVYGPRTTISIAIKSLPSMELILKDDKWFKTREFSTISEGKLFAPGNLRASQSHPGYNELLTYWLTNKYTLRYTGAMVPDLNQLLIKGKGVFCNPSTASAPAKLRLLYECAPMAYLFEQSGGRTSDGEKSLLDIPVSALDVRTQVCYGSKEEVERFQKLVGPAGS
uniref:fructose-bisphosphatase n=1 Tax=Rhodosorus marinus TaxID=101924 RepID=A0A7S3EGC8_9RHOD|mmetsp:Transcript_33838/g.132912  ORF Transcript_33838/g.132912 Transcript_33838/m.132912 type:complete len:302 (+) Transcript_33838:164-1069(+)|eukprot:CAMPEP_0113965636 /NCGR_PEP_ID=MMETSP0011_2-20120614/7856_1 /TAXON_ID=101924 /ORGANISM="Rhodosorus marinus" /LENGTH=301 /DNA_ID=CAMNT_0000978173 /DNA_START=45 /DNA_END=950 /DNA_ORIENTATION=+ /assembly_acc=CAM_ASM_000156